MILVIDFYKLPHSAVKMLSPFRILVCLSMFERWYSNKAECVSSRSASILRVQVLFFESHRENCIPGRYFILEVVLQNLAVAIIV